MSDKELPKLCMESKALTEVKNVTKMCTTLSWIYDDFAFNFSVH